MISRQSLVGHFPVKKLGEVVEFLDNLRRPVTESDREEGPYPYYGANGQQGTIEDFIFDEPLVLLAEDGGHFENPARGIAYRISGKTWVNNHAHVLRPKADIDIAYLCRVLENYDVTPFVTGTTRGKLTKGGASEIPIPLPPLREQRRIAAILDQADALRVKRREALAQLDRLAQSIFVEMFGDAHDIYERWPAKPLGDILDFMTSGSRGWAEYYSESGALFLRIQNVCRDELSLSDVAYVNAPDSAEARRTEVREGDVLLSITADLGRTAVVPAGLGKAHINQHLSILRTKAVAPRFLSAFLSSSAGQREVLGRNKHGVKAGLNFDDIRSFRIPLPPEPMQVEFVRRAHFVQEQSRLQEQTMANFNSLFSSLQHRAFRGEL